MRLKHITPIAEDGSRLFYRTHYDAQRGKVGGHYRGPIFIPPRGNDEKGLFRLLDPDNVIAQLRLYRWFHRERSKIRRAEGTDFSGLMLKEEMMEDCFADSPTVTKVRVGRLLRLIVQYETNFQRNARGQVPTQMFWRWSHPGDIIYGLEHLMLLWLPRVVEADGGSCASAEEFAEELEIIQGQTSEEDGDLVTTVLDRKLF